MKVAVVHNRVTAQDSPDARDVLIQADAVSGALVSLGHEVAILSCSLDLEKMQLSLRETEPDLVFNLVEELDGHGRLIHLFPSLLDSLKLPYTGPPSDAVFLTSHKTMAKQLMRSAGLPTPAWVGPYPSAGPLSAVKDEASIWIIKSLWEHASVGLDAGSVVNTGSTEILSSEMRKRCVSLGGSCFAEEFIDGREFNLSVLAGEHGPEILPPAEIIFEGFEPDMVRIVDYQAKWEEDSFTYHHTPRRFDFSAADLVLLDQLRDIARRCWDAFGLAGYVRVDFRVDRGGHPYILEINSSPCLSPDAGFAAAVERAGMGFDQAVARIVADAMKNCLQSEN